ncbi:MAG: alanyl-tRNA synthetase [Alphaproteobacteria bacterium]|nr:MAG: alanyl-tRNA synthetase [Caulobacteraceae bacterium]TPW07089.1 MAG: alanyl-tRNA synthetase [Alphaproteobacteria bacterium]
MPSKSKPSVNEIRAQFLDYFRARGHETPASSPLVPQSDPTLLFTNAGMVPFKNFFTGAETPPYPRAATSQKCVRAGGKHNDLDNVGYTARHHTFFEMLGNFSFGDYFKEQAIPHAWELLTKEWGLAKSKLCVTVYHDDDEAAAIWKKVAGLSDDKIIRIATSDNFWSMGDTGPCGPCSEIFYDHGDHIFGGPPGSPDQDGDRFVEIWNLVFMQFEQFADGRRESLPKPSIDTGMGLERIAAVLQGVHSNYEIDLFTTLIGASEELTGVRAEGDKAASHRVIADHLRASSFLIADGVSPSNEGRGYVLRRIMRRAMRHAHMLGAAEPLMHRLAPTLIAEMGGAYPELERARPVIVDQLKQEEERFRETLGRGLSLLEGELATLKKGKKLSGDTAFKLYDTFGFPLDLTQDILRGRGLEVDTDGFDAAMEGQREKGRKSWAGSGEAADENVWLAIKERVGATTFLGYEGIDGEGAVTAIVSQGAETKKLNAGDAGEIIFDRTPFYAESGGQAGDQGVIRFANGAVFEVEDTQKRAGALHGHVGRLVSGVVEIGAKAKLSARSERRDAIRANHSATHLLHAALRHVLGPHVSQKGSLVEADRFRFDFSHGAPVTAAEIEKVEDEVNAVIRQNAEASIKEMAPADAIAAGALALFGEKYGETVRVLSLGHDLAGPPASSRQPEGRQDAGGPVKPYSVELCGGTHVRRTGDIAVFTVLSEAGVASGIRRIEATTGAAALAHLKAQVALAKTIAANLKAPLAEAPERVALLAAEKRKLEAELSDVKKKLALAGGGGAAPAAGPEDVGGVMLLARVLDGVPAKDLRGLVDEGKAQLVSGVVAYVGVDAGKAALAIGVTDDLKGRVSAVDLIRAGVAAVGGQGGGGRPDMAQGGGPEAGKAGDAVSAIKAALEKALAA